MGLSEMSAAVGAYAIGWIAALALVAIVLPMVEAHRYRSVLPITLRDGYRLSLLSNVPTYVVSGALLVGSVSLGNWLGSHGSASPAHNASAGCYLLGLAAAIVSYFGTKLPVLFALARRLGISGPLWSAFVETALWTAAGAVVAVPVIGHVVALVLLRAAGV